MTLSLRSLEEAARKALPEQVNNARLIASCSPEVILSLVEVVRAAKEAADALERATKYTDADFSALAALRESLKGIGE